MSTSTKLTAHYLHGNLLHAIEEGIKKLGKTKESITIEELAPVDEFHIGSHEATKHFTDQLKINKQDKVLDIGCGLGGAARFVESAYQAKLHGVDLCHEYINTGNTLSSWLKSDVTLKQGSALDLDFQDKAFDAAYMIHLGMNIPDKFLLFKEIHRVLKHGASFGIYDVMLEKKASLAYPVPWASKEDTSFLETATNYKRALEEAGFEILAQTNRREFALAFFHKLQEKMKTMQAPPPLGLHTLMQKSTPLKVKNMIENISKAYLSPIEIIARKRV